MYIVMYRSVGAEMVSTDKDESRRQPSGDVITPMINGKTYHINRAPAMMAAAAC